MLFVIELKPLLFSGIVSLVPKNGDKTYIQMGRKEYAIHKPRYFHQKQMYLLAQTKSKCPCRNLTLFAKFMKTRILFSHQSVTCLYSGNGNGEILISASMSLLANNYVPGPLGP